MMTAKAALIAAICGIIKCFGPAIVQAIIIGLSDSVEISNEPENFGNVNDPIAEFERLRLQNKDRDAAGGAADVRANASKD